MLAGPDLIKAIEQAVEQLSRSVGVVDAEWVEELDQAGLQSQPDSANSDDEASITAYLESLERRNNPADGATDESSTV